MLVRDVMTHGPVTVSRDTTAKEALRILRDHRITALPVLSRDGRLRGMVSEVDLIRDRVLPDARAHEIPVEASHVDPPQRVEDVMTRMVVAVREDGELQEAVTLMSDLALRSLPVLDDDHRVVGIVSRSDVVRMLARDDEAIAHEVSVLMTDLGHRDWLVEVTDGAVEVAGPRTEADRTIAEAAASTVAGVVGVRVR